MKRILALSLTLACLLTTFVSADIHFTQMKKPRHAAGLLFALLRLPVGFDHFSARSILPSAAFLRTESMPLVQLAIFL